MWSLIGPLVIVVVGASLIWKGLAGPKLPVSSEGRAIQPGNHMSAVFSGSTAVFNGLPFTGAVTLALFGGADNHAATPKSGTPGPVIHVRSWAAFGGLDIKVK